MPRPCPASPSTLVFAAVESGQAACGLIAIENSLAGSIHHNYDLLLQHTLWIIGEHYLRVRHCLIANPGVDMADLQQGDQPPPGAGAVRRLPARACPARRGVL